MLPHAAMQKDKKDFYQVLTKGLNNKDQDHQIDHQ
jgi:hypothetical protein